MDIITGGIGDIAGYMTLVVNLGVFYGLCVWLFELDWMETCILFLFVTLLPFIVMIFLAATIAHMLI